MASYDSLTDMLCVSMWACIHSCRVLEYLPSALPTQIHVSSQCISFELELQFAIGFHRKHVHAIMKSCVMSKMSASCLKYMQHDGKDHL